MTTEKMAVGASNAHTVRILANVDNFKNHLECLKILVYQGLQRLQT